MTTENNTETFIITEFKSGGIDTVKSFLENNFSTYSAEVTAEVPQIDSEEGRRRIKALGAEINKKLSEVDTPMRDYLRDIKKQPKLIEAIAKENKEKFTELRAEILKPLEEAQKWQNDKLEWLAEIVQICASGNTDSEDLKAMIGQVESFNLDSVWPELKKKFKVAHENALTTARVTLERVGAAEAQAAELKRLQDEAKAREDEKKAEKAAEEARKQERAKAAAKLTNAVNARIKNELTIYPYQTKPMPSVWYQEQIARLQSTVIGDEWEPLQDDAHHYLQCSIVNAEDGIRLAEAAEQQAEKSNKARNEMNELHIEALSMDAAFNAAAAERKAIADEEARQKQEALARENDKKHRTTVNRRNLAVLLAMGISEDDGKKVITAIAKGELPDIRIYY